MGGYGSGRPPAASRKVCVEDCLRVSAEVVALLVEPAPAEAFTWHLRTYSGLSDEPQVETVEAVLVDLHRGRWYFWCPRPQCGRRARDLYRPPGAARYGCRHCHDLTYHSTQTWDARVAAGVRDPWFLKEDRPPESILEVRVIGATLERFRRRREGVR